MNTIQLNNGVTMALILDVPNVNEVYRLHNIRFEQS